jgi:hypothetical protein
MVGKQGVAAPVSSRFWDSYALYPSCCILYGYVNASGSYYNPRTVARMPAGDIR